jgi:hypothetical protein
MTCQYLDVMKQHRTFGSMNNELETVWKEAVVTASKYYIGFYVK